MVCYDADSTHLYLLWARAMDDHLRMNAVTPPLATSDATRPVLPDPTDPADSATSPDGASRDRTPLYRQLAGHYRQAIEAGTLAPGERMPSVRTLMDRHRVSLSTALHACRHLEAQGMLEARPRSGYFVRSPARASLVPVAEPRPWVPDLMQYVGINQRVSSILARGLQADVKINFAVAHGAASLYPVNALRQATLRALRDNRCSMAHRRPAAARPVFALPLRVARWKRA